MKMYILFVTLGMLFHIACTRAQTDDYPIENATVASFYTDSVPVDAMPGAGAYVTEIHGNSNITSNEPVKEDQPVVGSIPIGLNTYKVHCGKSNINCDRNGSLYINRVSKETGNPYRMYLSKAQKQKVDFY